MRKRFVKLLSLLVAVVMGSSALGGCNLITTNIDRDMDRVVATVYVTREENITKRDMIMHYMNYGYYYVQYYGYTAEQAYQMILDNTLQTRIMVQHIESEFENEPTEYGVETNSAETGIARFLSSEEVLDAKYNTYKSMNDLLESYKPHNHETDHEKQDTIIGEVRTTPTGAANATIERTTAQKDAYVKTYEANGFSLKTADEVSAYNKVVELLNSNSLLGDYDGDLRKSVYFTGTLKSNLENALIERYENRIRDNIVNALTYEKLEKLYEDTYNEQGEMTNKEFVETLSAATMTSPILVGNNGNYGYVYNILLGASTRQTDDIAKIKEDNANISDEDYASKRAEILADTVIRDLRSSWIQSGYDFDFESKKFTGDYTFAKDATNSLAFKGSVELIKEAVKDPDGVITENAKYSVTSLESYNLGDFLTMVEDYVGGFDNVSNQNSAYNMGADVPYAKSIKDGYTAEEYDAKMQELLFAFSTDPGSLNTYKGYLIKPPVDGADDEEFVKTFGDAGRKLLDTAKNGYVVVASDYGYHLMFYSARVNKTDYDYANLTDYLKTLGIKDTENSWARDDWKNYFNEQIKDWEKFIEADNYLYYLADSLVSAEITAETEYNRENVINKYRYEVDGGVVINQKVYDSLLGK